MAISVNRVTLVGRLGKDPEAAGRESEIVKFSVATSESWKDKRSGERKERVQWHNVVVFAEQAGKFIKQYGKKGDVVYVEGQIETRDYDDRDGNSRRVTEVVVRNFGGSVQLQSKQREDDGAGGREPPAEQAGASTKSRGDLPLDDDIPF